MWENGYGQVVGRIKEMIIRGGENISPKEVEEYLVSHPDIIDAQVLFYLWLQAFTFKNQQSYFFTVMEFFSRSDYF